MRLQFIQFGLDFFFDLFGHAVDEQDSVQMIGFVLHGAGEESAAAEGNGFAFFVQGGDIDGFRPGDFPEDFGKAEAALAAGGGLDRKSVV